MHLGVSDIRYAVRSLRRTPGFTLVALITLGLGIGGTTAIFSVVDGILLRPLPYPDSSNLVSVFRVTPNEDRGSFSAGAFLDYRRSSRSFAALAGYRQDVVNLTGRSQPVRLYALETTAAFFDVFRVTPLLGRVYSEATDSSAGPRIAVVSESLWRDHLGSDPNVIGSTLRLNGISTTVIGVLRNGFEDPADAELWMLAPREVPTSPIPIEGDALADREVHYFVAVGRLRPGGSGQETNVELRAIGDRLAREHAATGEAEFARVVSYRASLVGDVREGLLVLFAAVGFVLLIACTNVASLLLARSAARRRELAVRSALGAGRKRLVLQLLIESLVLSFAGGALGLMLAFWSVEALTAYAPATIPRLNEVSVDLRVAFFAAAATVLVGVAFGVVPALQGARVQVTDALKDGGRTGTARTNLQRALVVAEVALALVLLIGAGLMLTSFSRLRGVDVGFRTTNLVAIGVPLPQARYDAAAQTEFYTRLAERLRDTPATAKSAIAFPVPFRGAYADAGYRIEGSSSLSRVERPPADLSIVTPGYFATMGIPIVRGRDVAFSDVRGRPKIALINRTMAEREWPGQDPVGKRIVFGAEDPADPNEWLTIVGVVGDSRRSDLEHAQATAVYVPHGQFTLPLMAAVVRSEGSEGAVASAVRDAIRSLDPELPIGDVDLVDQLVDRATGQPRFRAFLIGAFALVALMLAGVGLYGLISYTVAQRVPEIGIRLALGATPRQVGSLIVRQGLGLAIAGVLIGIVGALAATRAISGLLFSVSATDPVVYSMLAALLLLIAGLACYIPARRAMRIDPVSALRAE
jgi:putative ABC transport system permease protein